MVDTSRPSIIDVTRSNKRAIIYLITGEPPEIADLPDGIDDPNGSVRLVVTQPLGEEDNFPFFQLKKNNVYNKTGLSVSSGSINVGLDLTISAASSFIETFNPSVADEHQRALVPHITFDDDGTDTSPHSPVLKPLDTSVIFGPAVSEITSTVIGISFATTHARIIETLFHEVGSIGASAAVRHRIFVGTDNTGLLVNERNLGIGEVVANSTLAMEFNFDLGLRNNSPYFIELSSSVAFSLKTDSGGNPLLSFLEEELGTLNMVTENLIWDNDLNHILDNSLNPMYLNQFPHSELTPTP